MNKLTGGWVLQKLGFGLSPYDELPIARTIRPPVIVTPDGMIKDIITSSKADPYGRKMRFGVKGERLGEIEYITVDMDTTLELNKNAKFTGETQIYIPQETWESITDPQIKKMLNEIKLKCEILENEKDKLTKKIMDYERDPEGYMDRLTQRQFKLAEAGKGGYRQGQEQ